MGISIRHWFDHGLKFTTISDLHYHLERNLESKISVFYTADSSDKWCQIVPYPKSKDYFCYEDLQSIAVKNKCDYFLEIIDENGNLTDFENQNIEELLQSKELHLFFSSVQDDIEVKISLKNLMISSSFLVFNCRMNTLGEIIENPEEGFTEDCLKILYRINKFVKVFDSQNMLLTGDTQSINWEDINDDLQYESYSIPEALEKYTNCGIKVITETMILNKEVEQNTSEKDFYNHVYYFNFKKLFPYLIPCEFREDPKEEENYYYPAPVRPPVIVLEASIETTENKAGAIKKELIRIAKNRDGHKDYDVTKESYDMNNELISSEELNNVACNEIFEQAKKIDYTNLVRKYFKYSKGNGKIYSLKYQNLDFSVSVSLWCSTHEERRPKEFVDFIKVIFNPPPKKYNRVYEVEGYPIDDIPIKEELNIR